MKPKSNSPTMFFRKVRAQELRAIEHYTGLERLVEEIERELIEAGILETEPPPSMTGAWLIALSTAIGRQAAHAPLGRFTVANLWFLGIGYLEIRGTPMFWYELSDDDHRFLEWFFSDEIGHYEDELTVRERLLIALMRRGMCAPRHFFPLLTTVA